MLKVSKIEANDRHAGTVAEALGPHCRGPLVPIESSGNFLNGGVWIQNFTETR